MKLKTESAGFYITGSILAIFLLLCVGCNFQKEVILNESLCVETEDDCHQIIKRGTKLPASFSDTYSTIEERQPDIQITLFQGEDLKIQGNRQIGTFNFPITQSPIAGESRIQITVTIEESKKLTLVAKDLDTGRQEEIAAGIVN